MHPRAAASALRSIAGIALGLLALLAVPCLAPRAVRAQAVCFQDQFGTVYHVQLLAIAGVHGGLVGEASLLFSTAPLTGNAHLRQNGDIHIGFAVHSASATTVPFSVQATLTAPSHNSGSGTSVNTASPAVTALALSPADCPLDLSTSAPQGAR